MKVKPRIALLVIGLLVWQGCEFGRAAPPTFDNVTSLDGKFLFQERWSDTDPAAVVPYPLTANSEVAGFDFTFLSVAVATPNVSRSPWSGATPVSPRVCVVAGHVPGVGTDYVWRGADGTEYHRSREWGGHLPGATASDYSVMILNEPLPAAIQPVKILADSSWLNGKKVVFVENDRHLNVLDIGIEQPGTASNASSVVYVSRPTSDNDAIEGGDSGKPVITFIAGEPVLVLTAMWTAGSTSTRTYGAGPNPSHTPALASLQAVCESVGESLDIVVDADPPPAPEPFPAGSYMLRGNGEQSITVGGLPLILEVE